MFYIKEKFNELTEVRVEITDENVFTICPRCGKEHNIDLAEILGTGDADLIETLVYCEKCTAVRRKRLKKQ